MVAFDVTASTDARELDALLAGLERACDAGLNAMAEHTAEAARGSHWYQNRSGDLEGSTRAVPGEGSVWDDSFSPYVVASEDYASYVDARHPILAPAWAAIGHREEVLFEDALAQACR